MAEPDRKIPPHIDMPWGDEARLQDLIRQIKGGNSNAYEELWVIIAPYVFRLMVVFNPKTERLDPEASERLTNEICSRLWENLDNYQPQPEASFFTWLYSFCRNWKMKLLKPGRLVSFPEEAYIDWAADGPDTKSVHYGAGRDKQWALKQKDSILNKLIRAEDRERLVKIKQALKQAIRELDPVEQYVIYTRFFDKLSYETIAERLEGNNQKEVYYRKICELSIKKLKRILQEKYGIWRLPEQET